MVRLLRNATTLRGPPLYLEEVSLDGFQFHHILCILAIFFERMTLLENQFQYNCRWLSQRDFTVYCLQVSLFHLGSFHTVLVVYLKVAATLRLCARYITLTCALQVYLKNLELHAFSMQKCRRYTCNAQINMNQRCRVATPL